MMKRLFCTILAAVAVLMTISARTYNPRSVPDPKAAGGDGFVSNPDGILSSSAVMDIGETCMRLRENANVELAVVALGEINTDDVADFAQRLFNRWGIGDKGSNQGVLILLVKESRDLRIHTGGGMEGLLPDAICKRIFEESMKPLLAEKKWDEGIMAGVREIERLINDPEAAQELKDRIMAEEREEVETVLFWWLAFSIIAAIVAAILMYFYTNWKPNKPNNVRYAHCAGLQTFLWCLGVAAPLTVLPMALWFKKLRRDMRLRPVKCPDCGAMMTLLSEQEEDAYLSLKRQTEEQIGSVDYDVWHCGTCGNNVILDYKNILSSYTKCPECGAIAFALISDKVITAPSSLHAGTGEKTYQCKHCNHSKVKRYRIPKTVVVAAGGKGGSFGGGGGSWGGGVSFGGGAGGKF